MDGVNGDPLVLFATEHGIPWIDKRNAGGSFWMIGNRELMDTLEELRKKGYVFNYAPAGSKSTDRRNAWFLRRIESSTEKSSIRQSAQTGVEQSHTRNVAEQAEENLVDNAIKRQRDAFYEWLRTRSGSYKKNSTENYLKLRKCEKILKNVGVIHCDIFEMADSDKIAQIPKSMTIMLREGHVDSQNTLICTQALRCYQHFLDEVACGKNRIPEKAIVSCDDKANESAMNNGSVKEEKLSEELQELLQDDDLKPLRDALKMQKITTILQLQKTNLWCFMNSQALYNVGQRQEIFRRLMERMKKKQDCEPAQQYSLKTENQTYLGATPAEELLEYCECIATKYPLKFRSLLDKPYNGGTVVLSRIDKTGDSLKMMNPVAFIGRELVCQDALLYAKWICKTCGETDEPQCMAEPEAKFVVVSEKEPRLEEVNEQAIADVDIQKNQTSSWKESGKAELPVGNKNLPLKPDEVNAKSRKNVWWRCSKCGNEWKSVINARVKGTVCPVCAEREVLAGYNDLATTDRPLLSEWDYEKNKWKPTEVSRNSAKRAWWKCRHGHSWSMLKNEAAKWNKFQSEIERTYPKLYFLLCVSSCQTGISL